MATAKYGLAEYYPHNPAKLIEFDVDPSTTAIYIGDLVKIVADKGVAQSAGGETANIGVAVGFKDSSGLPVAYYPAGNATGYKAIVNTDASQVYMVHYYNSTTALADTDIGTCADIVVGTGNTKTGLSGSYITSVTTGAANLRLLGLAPIEGNEYGKDCEVLVTINEHVDRPGNSGV